MHLNREICVVVKESQAMGDKEEEEEEEDAVRSVSFSGHDTVHSIAR